MDKVTMKIYRDVYKDLQQYKLDNNLVSLSEAIKMLLKKDK